MKIAGCQRKTPSWRARAYIVNVYARHESIFFCHCGIILSMSLLNIEIERTKQGFLLPESATKIMVCEDIVLYLCFLVVFIFGVGGIFGVSQCWCGL